MPSYPAAPTLQVGGRVFTDLVNLIYLIGFNNDSTNKYCSPRLANGTTGYQIPTGKTLRIWAARITAASPNSGTVARAINLGYNDNDLGINGTTAPTTPIYLGGSSTITYLNIGGGVIPSPPTTEWTLDFTVPQNKYVFTAETSSQAISATYEFWGYLE